MRKSFTAILCIIVLFATFTARANEPPNSVFWKVENGTLEISGQGKMDDFSNTDCIPWFEQRNEITKIVIQDGITHIGDLAFYGLTKAQEVIVPETVETVGVCAFSYAEGIRTSVNGEDSPYQFQIESDALVASKGKEFNVTISLCADFKDVSGVQTTLVYDKNKVSIDSKDWCDSTWLESIDETNLGYIGNPMVGFVANNLRLAYFSLQGDRIDENSPLYTRGETTIPIAKIKCKALTDIENIDISCFMIKNSKVLTSNGDQSESPLCGENQLPTVTKLLMPQLLVTTESPAVEEYVTSGGNSPATDKGISVYVDGKEVKYDVAPYTDNSAVMVPLRHTAEALGAVVSWQNESKVAFSFFNNEISAVQIGQNLIFKNSGETPMQTDALLKGNRTMVPLDYFEKAFGVKVNFDESTKTITIE